MMYVMFLAMGLIAGFTFGVMYSLSIVEDKNGKV